MMIREAPSPDTDPLGPRRRYDMTVQVSWRRNYSSAIGISMSISRSIATYSDESKPNHISTAENGPCHPRWFEEGCQERRKGASSGTLQRAVNMPWSLWQLS